MAPYTATVPKPAEHGPAGQTQQKQQATLTESPEQVLRQAILQLPTELARVRWYPDLGKDQPGGKLLVHVASLKGESPIPSLSSAAPDSALQRILTHLTRAPSVYSMYVGGLNDASAEACRHSLKKIVENSRSAEKLEQYFGTKDAHASDALFARSRAQFGKVLNETQKEILQALSFLRDHQRAKAQTAANPVLSVALARGLEVVSGGSAQDALVERIGQIGARTNLTVLGGGVSLREQVDRWNSANPSAKLALVEIEPI